MSKVNLNEISSLIAKWLQNSSIDLPQLIDDKLVEKAISIVLYHNQDNEDSLFLQLCALNFLNAVIKTEAFKNKLSYNLIKSNAAKLIKTIDTLRNEEISYYYNKEEYCLYIKLGNIVFSFHHVPLITEVLKASFATPIKWPGIRLQKIAQPLLNYALSKNNEIEITPVKINDVLIEEVIDTSSEKGFHSTGISNNEGIESENNDTITSRSHQKVLTEIEKKTIKQRILSIIDSCCSSDSEEWYNLVEIAPRIKSNGVDYLEYGFKKLAPFLEAVFGASMQRRNEGAMVYLRFPLTNNKVLHNPQYSMLGKEENLQESFDILSGIQVGDNVEINCFGNIKTGEISILNKQFVQLELKGGRSIRIKYDSIASIEVASFYNLIDLSFANDIIKNILISDGLYTSSLIETNATITMVESRRIWLVTDEGKNASCSKVSLIGNNKENLIKGQRIFAFPFKGEKAYCVLMEMTYYELFECFKKLVLQKKDNAKDIQMSQIFSLLRFVSNKTTNSESQTKIKQP